MITAIKLVAGWLMNQEWFRKVMVILSIMLAVLIALAGIKSKARTVGRQIERENQRVEIKKAKERMDRVKLPTTSELDARLRNGTF